MLETPAKAALPALRKIVSDAKAPVSISISFFSTSFWR